MDIIYSIAHKIIKERQESGQPHVETVIQPRQDVFDSTNIKVITLIESLLKIYKTGKTFGSFDKDKENHPFQSWLSDLQSPVYTKDTFILLTLNVVNRIKLFIESQNFATGGYLVFVHYIHNNQTYFLIVMIKDKGGLTFTSELELSDVHQIDLDKLHQAARIDLNRLYSQEETYLSFLKGNKKNDITGYFTNALGCTDLVPSNIATDNVFHLVDKICTDAGVSEKKQIRNAIHDFLKERHPESVMLEEISAKLNSFLPLEYHEQFIEHANSEKYCISQEFIPNLNALKKYKRIHYKASSWDLSFDKNSLGIPNSQAEIVFDAEEKSLTINNLPPKLMEELGKVLAESDE